MGLYAGWNDRDRWSYDIHTLADVFTNYSGNAGWALDRWLFEE